MHTAAPNLSASPLLSFDATSVFCVLANDLVSHCCCCLRVRDAQDTMVYRTKNIFLTKEQLAANATLYENQKSAMLRSDKAVSRAR